jgi:hypothetical protein
MVLVDEEPIETKGMSRSCVCWSDKVFALQLFFPGRLTGVS